MMTHIASCLVLSLGHSSCMCYTVDCLKVCNGSIESHDNIVGGEFDMMLVNTKLSFPPSLAPYISIVL